MNLVSLARHIYLAISAIPTLESGGRKLNIGLGLSVSDRIFPEILTVLLFDWNDGNGAFFKMY